MANVSYLTVNSKKLTITDATARSNITTVTNRVKAVEDAIASFSVDTIYVTPEQFGAKGDGVTDDTNAVQQAITNSATNHVPVFAFKQYKVTNITVNSYASIVGSSGVGRIQNYGTADEKKKSYTFIVSGTFTCASDVLFQNVKFYGNGSNTIIKKKEDGTYRIVCLNCAFANCDTCIDLSQSVVTTWGGEHIVDGCYFDGGNYGIKTGYGSDSIIRNSICASTCQRFVDYVLGSWIFMGNHDYSVLGTRFRNHCLVFNNYFDGANKFEYAGSGGIFDGNYFLIGKTGTDPAGMNFTDSVQYLTFTNNTFEYSGEAGGTRYGIKFTNSGTFYFNHNTFNNNTCYGVTYVKTSDLVNHINCYYSNVVDFPLCDVNLTDGTYWWELHGNSATLYIVGTTANTTVGTITSYGQVRAVGFRYSNAPLAWPEFYSSKTPALLSGGLSTGASKSGATQYFIKYDITWGASD